MKRYICVFTILMVVLFIQTNCAEDILMPIAGDLECEILLNQAVGQHTQVTVTCEGDNFTAADYSGAGGSANWTESNDFSDGDQTPSMIVEKSYLKAGEWDIRINVVGDGTTLNFPSGRFRTKVFAGQLTRLRFIEGAASPTCTMGCPPP